MRPRKDNFIYTGEQNLRLLDEQVQAFGRQAKFALLTVAAAFALGVGLIGYAVHQEMSRSDSVAYVPQYEMNSYKR